VPLATIRCGCGRFGRRADDEREQATADVVVVIGGAALYDHVVTFEERDASV
jgi:hypothetical protein